MNVPMRVSGLVPWGFSLALLFASCHREEGPPTPLAVIPEDTGPVVARVGDREVHLGEIAELSQMALVVRNDAGQKTKPPTTPQEQLALATELLALAISADPAAASQREVIEPQKRALARLFLDRALRPVEAAPVTIQDAEAAHRQEIDHYAMTGESDLYQPTRVNAVAIVVGLFPDLKPPGSKETPVVSQSEAAALGRKVREACGDRLSDLDHFYAIARQFMMGHPTVQVKDYGGVPLLYRLAGDVPEAMHRALVGLDGAGAISQPIPFDGGVAVIRRGVSTPGKGENLDSIRPQVEDWVRNQRIKSTFDGLMSDLKKKFKIAVFPDRLPDTLKGAPEP